MIVRSIQSESDVFWGPQCICLRSKTFFGVMLHRNEWGSTSEAVSRSHYASIVCIRGGLSVNLQKAC